ncbi:hypothetical protein [Christiangramia salexigens]|uniref:Uncharacterized protein n=1 Tax=Christiangramia salexigens TaxID=1913577 RepID=A0A1L3J5L6_9FLAO|nr:hypothetical protein [Christiangramia salexigens]APG60427.1 hypothetical protein LPB144_08425 [Christiangramia salexigens]
MLKNLIYNLSGSIVIRASIFLVNFIFISFQDDFNFGKFSYLYSNSLAIGAFALLGSNVYVCTLSDLRRIEIYSLVSLQKIISAFVIIIFTILSYFIYPIDDIISFLIMAILSSFLLLNNAALTSLKDDLYIAKAGFVFFISLFVALFILRDNENYILVTIIASASHFLFLEIYWLRKFGILPIQSFYIFIKTKYSNFFLKSLPIGIGGLFTSMVIVFTNKFMISDLNFEEFAVVGKLRQVQALGLFLPSIILPFILSNSELAIIKIKKYFNFLIFAIIIYTFCSLILKNYYSHFIVYIMVLDAVVISGLGLLITPLIIKKSTKELLYLNLIWGFVFVLALLFLGPKISSFALAILWSYSIQTIFGFIKVRNEIFSNSIKIIVIILINMLSSSYLI